MLRENGLFWALTPFGKAPQNDCGAFFKRSTRAAKWRPENFIGLLSLFAPCSAVAAMQVAPPSTRAAAFKGSQSGRPYYEVLASVLRLSQG